MPQVYATAPATVIALLGQAIARSPGGGLRQLAVGDRVAEGDVIITAQNGFVQLVADAGQPTAEPPAARTAREPLPVVVDAEPAGLMPALRIDAVSEAIPATLVPVPALVAEAIVNSARSASDRLAPEAENQRLSATEDTALAISLVGRDPDGTVTRFLVLQVPTGGVMYRANGQPFGDGTGLSPVEAGQLRFVPAPDFHGDPGPLLYRSIDASGKVSGVAAVTIHVDAVNDAPVPGSVPLGPDDVAIADPSPNHLPGSGDYAYQTRSDTALAGRVNASDVDGDRLQFAAAADPLHGRVSVDADGSFVYRPDPGYSGNDRFTVRIDDGHGGLATSTVFVQVADAAPASAAAPDLPPADLTLALAWAAPGDDVFAWSLAEPAAPGIGYWEPALASVTAQGPALDLRDLFAGDAALEFGAQAGSGPVASPSNVVLPAPELDLAVDWGLRSSGLDPLSTEAALPID